MVRFAAMRSRPGSGWSVVNCITNAIHEHGRRRDPRETPVGRIRADSERVGPASRRLAELALTRRQRANPGHAPDDPRAPDAKPRGVGVGASGRRGTRARRRVVGVGAPTCARDARHGPAPDADGVWLPRGSLGPSRVARARQHGSRSVHAVAAALIPGQEGSRRISALHPARPGRYGPVCGHGSRHRSSARGLCVPEGVACAHRVRLDAGAVDASGQFYTEDAWYRFRPSSSAMAEAPGVTHVLELDMPGLTRRRRGCPTPRCPGRAARAPSLPAACTVPDASL